MVTIGGADLGGLDMYLLRSAVIVLDRPTIVEVTIREYLSLAAPGTGSDAMLDVLEQVDLADRVARLPEGLDTPLASSGWPLSIGEVMELKLANALLSRPRVLVLSPLFDLMQPDKLARALATLRDAGTTVILFTAKPGNIELDGWMLMDVVSQRRFSTLDALENARSAGEPARAL
ncbi:hypothetical protein WR25_21424 [Diploscapter pachys]|jgi:putative ABC transport system ATP-binding protein|uniref:ABC transporter domain-containing protein n=1 Tax=Diploscapter pachys TaxID=2018661 RepID=A0A2A2K880_9BILA|nr:hypothetical protein WR25_21424 [Diploscapter pachys]